jgi:hypothetical protein
MIDHVLQSLKPAAAAFAAAAADAAAIDGDAAAVAAGKLPYSAVAA